MYYLSSQCWSNVSPESGFSDSANSASQRRVPKLWDPCLYPSCLGIRAQYPALCVPTLSLHWYFQPNLKYKCTFYWQKLFYLFSILRPSLTCVSRCDFSETGERRSCLVNLFAQTNDLMSWFLKIPIYRSRDFSGLLDTNESGISGHYYIGRVSGLHELWRTFLCFLSIIH